ncbi:tRNA-(MS[2]IO[6]A)-hydroxylase MiaE-like protein [Actinomycetospora succinea]|uniref:tRNA-(MS[2]IO[6]A)-hydroxylase MiaE-like protein n=1 Tax=Actinomycetospora succinea TaxID=663603 RepID=A0A4R6V9V9_9PSEU|nr:ferritin-like fold-containing protein [Actinomycetospora succinea]TDQ58493.1 tRNA-(MS[2]IO[6]A)-hydroxylase MiaE-like protein [Actinomycetospora succinea]
MTEHDSGRPAPTAPTAAQDPPVDLLGAVAYGALTAFTRLAADAALAPDLTGRAEMAALAAVEMAHVERIREHLDSRGVDLVTSMAPFAPVLDSFAARTASRDWGEALVGAYVGRTLAVDLVAATGAADAPGGELLRGPDAGREAGGESGFDAFAERAVREVAVDDQTRGRLAMWGRRLLGETLAAAAEVLDEHPQAAAALLGGTGRAVVFKALKSRHTKRLAALGL